MINIDNKYDIGQIIYLKTDEDQKQRIVVSIMCNKYDILYEVIAGTFVSRHYDFEIQEEANVLQSLK